MGAASRGFARWKLGSHNRGNDYGSFPWGSIIQLAVGDSRVRIAGVRKQREAHSLRGQKRLLEMKVSLCNLPKCWAKMILQQNHFNAWYFAAQAGCGLLLGSVAYPSLVPKCFKMSFTPEHWSFLPSNTFNSDSELTETECSKSSSFAEGCGVAEPSVSRGCSHTLLWHRAERKAAHKAGKQTLTWHLPSREWGGSCLLPGVSSEVEAALTGVFSAEAPGLSLRFAQPQASFPMVKEAHRPQVFIAGCAARSLTRFW